MAAHPIADELAARLVALFPLYNDIEIGNQVSLNRTTVGKHRAVWRAAELAKLAQSPPLDPPHKSANIDKMASLGPPPSWASCAPQVRVAPLPPGVTAGGDTIPSPPYPNGVRAYPEVAPSDNKGAAVVGGENKLRKIIFVGDSHHPFHDERAWGLAMNAAAAFGPDILVHMGDLVDCYAISQFCKDPHRTLRIEDEIISGRDALDEMQSIGADENHICLGNHERRWKTYLIKRSPEMYNAAGDMTSQLGLSDRGWHVTEYGDFSMLGDLLISHELGKWGKYAVEHARVDSESKVAIGHVHKLKAHYENSAVTKRSMGGFSFGWLGDFDQVDYQHKAKSNRNFQHGMGYGYMESDGTVHAYPVPFVDYSCVIEGRRVSA